MKVTLYGVDGCHRCQFISEMLKKRGIEYTKISDVDVIVAKDLDSIPAMEVDGQIFYETAAIAWLAKHKKQE